MRFCLHITFDRTEIEQWGWYQIVSLAQTHWVTCNMTYLGHHVASRNLGLRSNLTLFFFRSTCMYSDVSQRQERDGVRIWFLAFLVQTIVAKNYFVYFYISWNLKPNPSKIGQFWQQASKKAQKSSIASFRAFLPVIASEIIAHFQRNMVFR